MTEAKFAVGEIVHHPLFGHGRVTAIGDDHYSIYFSKEGCKQVAKTFEFLKPGREGLDETQRALEALVWRLCEENVGLPDAFYEIGEKWRNGALVLKPGKDDVQTREVPLEVFFRKIVSVREKLRVLEQKINNHPKLDDAERLELIQYLTQAQGSLTTFNCLFDEKRSYFVGQKGS
jgi:hypothetical protein